MLSAKLTVEDFATQSRNQRISTHEERARSTLASNQTELPKSKFATQLLPSDRYQTQKKRVVSGRPSRR